MIILGIALFSSQLLVKGTVFARMSPDQKAQLVTALMDIGYSTVLIMTGC